jgi:large subunit ribosomal protein L30
MAKKLAIQQVVSAIGKTEKMKRTVRALGIRRLNQTVVLDDAPAVRGMIYKVRHLVEVKEVE